MTAPVTIATAFCDQRDFERHTNTTDCHASATAHGQRTGHRVMVVETTVTTYEPETAMAQAVSR